MGKWFNGLGHFKYLVFNDVSFYVILKSEVTLSVKNSRILNGNKTGYCRAYSHDCSLTVKTI